MFLFPFAVNWIRLWFFSIALLQQIFSLGFSYAFLFSFLFVYLKLLIFFLSLSFGQLHDILADYIQGENIVFILFACYISFLFLRCTYLILLLLLLLLAFSGYKKRT